MGAGGLCQGHIWDDEEDTFDLCFQRQVLSSLPLLLLLLLMPVSYLYRLRSTPARHGKCTHLAMQATMCPPLALGAMHDPSPSPGPCAQV